MQIPCKKRYSQTFFVIHDTKYHAHRQPQTRNQLCTNILQSTTIYANRKRTLLHNGDLNHKKLAIIIILCYFCRYRCIFRFRGTILAYRKSYNPFPENRIKPYRMKTAAVILAGCGAKDGSEIHEATLALYALAKEGFKTSVFAPDTDSKDVIDHITDRPMNEKRNVMTEAARIARGAIAPLSSLVPSEYDVLVLPGGFGAAKNLFTLAADGLGFSVLPEVRDAVLAFHNAGKPIGAMCISPVMIAALLGDKGVEVTFGPESEMCAAAREKFGAKVTVCDRDGVVVDRANKVVTTPCYMYGDSSIAHIGDGAIAMAREISSLIK